MHSINDVLPAVGVEGAAATDSFCLIAPHCQLKKQDEEKPKAQLQVSHTVELRALFFFLLAVHKF